MPLEASELRISLEKLLIGLVVAIVPLSIAGLYITTRSDHSFEQTTGTQYKAIAESTVNTIAQFVADRITDCAIIAADPTVVEAIDASNNSEKRGSDAALQARIDEIRKSWNSAGSGAAAAAILSSPAARLLRQRREIDPRFLRITVADQVGVSVAATDRPSDYWQAEQSYWQGVYAGGRGAVAVRDVQYDDATKTTYLSVAVPVKDAASGQFIGAVDALVDMSGLLQRLVREQMNPTIKTIVAKSDGGIIAAPSVNLSMNLKSDEYAAIRDALGTIGGRQTGYIVVDLQGGSRNIVGFADTGLKAGTSNLNWVVMISQDLRDAMAPVRAVGNFALVMVVLGLLMLILMGAYVFLHRRPRFEEIEPLAARSAT